MAHGKGAAAPSKGKSGSAVNATTGNKITRDSSSGRFYVTKTETYPTAPPKSTKALAGSTLSSKGAGSFTINKRKAEKAEQVVVEYINKSKK